MHCLFIQACTAYNKYFFFFAGKAPKVNWDAIEQKPNVATRAASATVLDIAQQLYITFIDDTSKEADAYFPEIKKEEWKETGREDHPTDEKQYSHKNI